MKYCTKCGAQIPEGTSVCTQCGCSNEEPKKQAETSAVKIAAEILMIVSCVICAVFVVTLFWMIPMTVYYFKKVKRNEPVSLAFQICTLLFVNIIAGVLMIIEEKV